MKAFLAGLGIGVGLGILFAPMSGEETRENISHRAGDLVDQGRERVRTTVSAMRGKVERFADKVEATGTEPRNF